MSTPVMARDYVWDREHGICQGCGKDLNEPIKEVLSETGIVLWRYHSTWEADHHRPLFEAQGNLSYWHPDNLRLLCSDCHLEKTKTEATRRALIKTNKDIDDS